jgi:hypothetical protein
VKDIYNLQLVTCNADKMGITHVKHPEEDFLQLPTPFPNLVILRAILVALQVCDLLCPSGQLTFDHTMSDYVTWLNKSQGNLYYAYKHR